MLLLTHYLNKWWVFGLPSNYTSKMYKSLVLRPKNLFQEHIDVCKKYPVQCPAACGVEVPREKVCLFVCSPVLHQLIYLVFKNHTENVKLNSGCISLISLITRKLLRTSKTSIISCLSFHFVSHPERSGNSCFYFSNLGASNQEC